MVGINPPLFAWAEWDYYFPRTLWECYAPQFLAPASHKERHPDKLGTVRHEFGGWTCCLINLLIESVMGLQVNAPQNALAWDLRLVDDHGVEKLRFGDVTTNLYVAARSDPGARAEIKVHSDAPYTLRVTVEERAVQYDVPEGESCLWV